MNGGGNVRRMDAQHFSNLIEFVRHVFSFGPAGPLV
jgi:hypothetical protein